MKHYKLLICLIAVVMLFIAGIGVHNTLSGGQVMGGPTKINLADPNSVDPFATTTPTASSIPISIGTVLDHGWLGGTTAGDLFYSNGATSTRLGIGTAGQVLTVNSGATAPEWFTPLFDKSDGTESLGAHTTETTITSSTIPAGTLRVGDIVRIKASVLINQLPDSSVHFFRVKVGGSTLVTSQQSVGAGENSVHSATIDIHFTGTGQQTYTSEYGKRLSTQSVIVKNTEFGGNLSFDETGDITVAFTSASNSTSATIDARYFTYTIEIIR